MLKEFLTDGDGAKLFKSAVHIPWVAVLLQ